jgi:hypothetical protein
MNPINHISLPSTPPFTVPFFQKYPPNCTYFIVLSFIINSKVSFQRGFSKYACCDILYFSQFNPFHYSSLHFLSHLPLFNSFQYILRYPLPTQMQSVSTMTLFLSLLPWVPQSNSTTTNMFYIQVCIWSCLFGIYVYLLDLSFTYKRKHSAFVFLNWLTSLHMMSSNCIHLTFRPHAFILPYGWVKLHIYLMDMYATFS